MFEGAEAWEALPQYMLSIRPEWVMKALAGEKLADVRLTGPRFGRARGAVVWVYETKAGGGRGAVVARFHCPAVHPVGPQALMQRWRELERQSGLTLEELLAYQGKHRLLYFWEIEEMQALPITLPVRLFGLKCPPQSWTHCHLPWSFGPWGAGWEWKTLETDLS